MARACRSARRRPRRRRPGAASSSSGAAASVSTVRLWTSSEWRSSSSARAEGGADRRDRVRRRGPRRSWGPRAPPGGSAADQQLARAHQRLAVDADVGLAGRRSRGGSGPGPCRRSPPRRRRRRGRCRGSSRPRAARRSAPPSRWCRSRARRRWSPARRRGFAAARAAARPRRRSRRPGGRPRPSSSTGSETRPIEAIVPSTTSVPSAVPSIGAMKPSPHGRLPNAPGAVRSPASGIASRSPSPSRRSEPFAHVTRASAPAVRTAGDRGALAAQALHVRRHHPGEHLLGRAGQGRDPHPGLGRRLARGRVRERLHRRAEDDVGRRHRRGDRARRLGPGLGPLGDQREDAVGAERGRPRRESARRARSSPGWRPRAPPRPRAPRGNRARPRSPARSRSPIGPS